LEIVAGSDSGKEYNGIEHIYRQGLATHPVKALIAPSCNQGFYVLNLTILRRLSHISFIVQLPLCFAIQNAPKLPPQAT
jgi:hypothetical protein